MLRQKLPHKLAERLRLAQRHTERKDTKRRDKIVHKKRNVARRQLLTVRETFASQLVAAREARRENWELGPLAPRRDVGENARTYGTADGSQLRPVRRPEFLYTSWVDRHLSPAKRMEKHGWTQVDMKDVPFGTAYKYRNHTAWEKKGNFFHEGDRVVVVGGPSTGKVGLIKKVHRKAGLVTISGVNEVEYRTPAWLRKRLGQSNELSVYEMPIPEGDVRLVAKFPHRVKSRGPDGEAREAPEFIVDQMILRVAMAKDGTTESIQRLVPGLEWRIHRNNYEPPSQSIEEDYGPEDTLRITSEEATFLPSLVSVPMPETVIDELRNPYSKLRSRHTDEYIAKVEAKEAVKKAKEKSVALMQTPLAAFNRLGKAALRTEARRRMKEFGTNEKIGEAVWRHLTAAKQAQEARS